MGDAADSHAHGDRHQRIDRAKAPINHLDVGVFRQKDVVHFRQPGLRTAGEGKQKLFDLHRFPVAVWKALLDLVVTPNVNFPAR